MKKIIQMLMCLYIAYWVYTNLEFLYAVLPQSESSHEALVKESKAAEKCRNMKDIKKECKAFDLSLDGFNDVIKLNESYAQAMKNCAIQNLTAFVCFIVLILLQSGKRRYIKGFEPS